jgi:cell division septation protein DedD
MGTSSQSFDGSVVGFFSSPDSGEVLITNRQLIALFVATVLLSGLAFGLGVHAGSRMTAQVRLVNPGDLAVADRRANLPVETAPVTDTIADAPAPAPAPAVAAPAVAATTPKVRELTPIEESALAAQKEQADKAANAAKAEKAEKEKAVAATSKLGPFMVQTSSWPDKAGAEKACGIWAQRGFGCATNPAEVKGKGTWYQVRIGAYPTADAAKKALVQLKRDFGLNGMVAKAAQRV